MNTLALKMFNLLFIFSFFFVFLELILTQVIYDGPYYDEESDEYDHFYSKIDCKVGDKYHYVMATQSSLFNENKENLQIKAKLEVECLQKTQWLNETNGEFKPSQVMGVRILSIEPTRNAKITNNNDPTGQLQMATLFANLQNIHNSNDNEKNSWESKNKNNVTLAVNSFFVQLTERFSKWLSEVFERLILYIKGLFNKKRTNPDEKFSWNCEDDDVINNTNRKPLPMERRQKRANSKPIDLGQFTLQYSKMLSHPFKFIQLEDGSVQNIQLSKLDTDSNLIRYKKFIAQAFGTQLDERKKTSIEKTELGIHYSHYRMEYDEPDSERISPKQYMSTKYRSRTKRLVGDDESQHLVSVIRQFKNKDLIEENYSQGNEKNFGLIQLDFNVQEVQLIRGNMVVASGGYFQGFLADEPKTNRVRRDKTLEPNDFFDQFLRKHLDLNLQYSMVKLGDNRRKRSIIENDSGATINYADKIVKLLFSNVDTGPINTIKRNKRDNSDFFTGPNKVVCQKVARPDNLTDDRDNNIIEEPNQFWQCNEYKTFGSEMLNAHFNRTIIGSERNKSLDNFQIVYSIGAKFFHMNFFMGKIDLSKSNHPAKLSVNLFGSEYANLSLCDVQNKIYSQSDTIPLFGKDIWFVNNVNLKIKYKLDFKFDIPKLNCVETEQIKILNGDIPEQFELNQITNVEFGAYAEASFVILNGQMKINGHFDMSSLLDFTGSCLAAKSHVKPFEVGIDFDYEFFHPICGKWMKDTWKPKSLSWKLNQDYQKSWLPNTCI